MHLPEPLQDGVLLRRYKRFLADVRLDDGREVTAHCPNPGRMTSCAIPGGRVRLSHHDDPRRKLAWTWQLAWGGEHGSAHILINTNLANAVVAEALEKDRIPALAGYERLRREVRYGRDNKSRIDFLLEGRPGAPEARCYVEVKSVTLLAEPGVAAFPDAVTARGRKHLGELVEVVAEGHRAVQLFLLSRDDAARVRPADEVDPAYAQALRDAAAAGVEVLAVRTHFEGSALRCDGMVPVTL